MRLATLMSDINRRLAAAPPANSIAGGKHCRRQPLSGATRIPPYGAAVSVPTPLSRRCQAFSRHLHGTSAHPVRNCIAMQRGAYHESSPYVWRKRPSRPYLASRGAPLFLPMIVTPFSLTVKPRAWSRAESQPISSPAGILTSLSMIVRWTFACRPMVTPSARIDSVTQA